MLALGCLWGAERMAVALPHEGWLARSSFQAREEVGLQLCLAVLLTLFPGGAFAAHPFGRVHAAGNVWRFPTSLRRALSISVVSHVDHVAVGTLQGVSARAQSGGLGE